MSQLHNLHGYRPVFVSEHNKSSTDRPSYYNKYSNNKNGNNSGNSSKKNSPIVSNVLTYENTEPVEDVTQQFLHDIEENKNTKPHMITYSMINELDMKVENCTENQQTLYNSIDKLILVAEETQKCNNDVQADQKIIKTLLNESLLTKNKGNNGNNDHIKLVENNINSFKDKLIEHQQFISTQTNKSAHHVCKELVKFKNMLDEKYNQENFVINIKEDLNQVRQDVKDLRDYQVKYHKKEDEYFKNLSNLSNGGNGSEWQQDVTGRLNMLRTSLISVSNKLDRLDDSIPHKQFSWDHHPEKKTKETNQFRIENVTGVLFGLFIILVAIVIVTSNIFGNTK